MEPLLEPKAGVESGTGNRQSGGNATQDHLHRTNEPGDHELDSSSAHQDKIVVKKSQQQYFVDNTNPEGGHMEKCRFVTIMTPMLG